MNLRFPSLYRFLPVLLSACLGAFAWSAVTAHAQSESFLVTNDTAPAYRKVPEIENQLYGHGYPNQAVSQRINRIERTLFGAAQRGPSELRMRRIEDHMREQKSKATLAEQEPILAYLEEKLFQRTYQDRPLTDRIRQLETQVFGHSFDSYPPAIRIKKLTYAMPIMAKEIRLTKGDTVIASSGRVSQRPPRNAAPQVDLIQLDASSPNTHVLPGGKPLSTGDYSQAVHRDSNGATLRWRDLPIKVYVKPGDVDPAISAQAIRSWQTAFSVQAVPNSPQADVIVAWDKPTWDQNTTGLLTRPVVQVDDQHNIRTVILISMYSLRGAEPRIQLHTLTHQLGHAFGIWGHSDDPDDIMYPALKPEMNDYPAKWGWRSVSVMTKVQPSGLVTSYQPSQRDFNTLLKLYDLPVSDLSAYSPY
ncbi:MAG: Peptidase, metallopeptidase [Vampirovibrio sp.]|jgi:hypothetical protein|nr:Peptidase, metallopeptidase [Vampirovibrio sp.]